MSQFVEKLEKEREDHKQSIKKLTLAELRVKVSYPFSLTLCYSTRTGNATFQDWGRKKNCLMKSSTPNLGEAQESATSISWSLLLWNRKCLILGPWLEFSSLLEHMKSSITVPKSRSITQAHVQTSHQLQRLKACHNITKRYLLLRSASMANG